MYVYFRFFSQLAHMNFNHEESGFSSSTCSSSSSFSVPCSWEDSSLQQPITTIETSSFITNSQPEEKQEKDDPCLLSCNQRNKDWISNTLRILQMITKGKPLRNRTLANYKAFVRVESEKKRKRGEKEEEEKVVQYI